MGGQVVYWWAIAPGADGSHAVGVNTRNVLPSDMLLVERRIMFDATTERDFKASG